MLKNSLMVKVMALGGLLWSPVLLADDWSLSPNDSTYKILTFFFGTVSEDLICLDSSCSYLVPQLMAIFNQGFIVFSALVLSFVLMVSTASSAHEGEFLGKRMSSMGTPFRLLIGSGLLLPTQTGYSQLQIIMMKFILFGVVLGNNVYAVLRNYVTTNRVTFAMENVNNTSSADMMADVAKLSSTIYNCEFCYAYVQNLINTNQLNTTDAKKWGITEGDTMTQGPLYFSCDDNFYGYAYTTDEVTSVVTKCSTNTYLNPSPNVCGTWAYYFAQSDPNRTITESILTQLQLSLRTVAYNDLAYLVNNHYKMDYEAGRASAEIISQSIALTTQQLNFSYVAPNDAPSNSSADNDWLDFPINFYTWLRYGSDLNIPNYISPLTYTVGAVQDTTSGLYTETYSNAKNSLNLQKYFDEKTLRNKLYLDDGVAEYEFVGRDGGPISYTFTEIGKMIKNGQEPLVTLTQYGLKLLTFAFDMMMTAMIMGSLLVIAGSIFSSYNAGYGASVVMAFTGFIQNFFMAFGFLIPLGISMGIYLPMVPIMTYTGAVTGWLMTVIEAMVAGPVIALGIMAPGDGHSVLGRAQPAFLMLVRLMLGPALIVLGLVVGAKMFDIFASYFTQIFIYGFSYVTSTGNYGAWVGLIFIPYFFFYGTFMVGLGVRCYSLTYLLLDKTTSWVGGQAGASAREMQQILDEGRSGAEQGGSEMQTQTQKVSDAVAKLSQSLAKAAAEEAKKKEGEQQEQNSDDNTAQPQNQGQGQGGGGQGGGGQGGGPSAGGGPIPGGTP